MAKRFTVRRVADAIFALLTWVAAAAAVMWFYDWVSRWYVVVAVLLVIVAGASFGDRLKAARAASSEEVVELLPMQRESVEPVELAS
jgi:ABC-type bacteriocin/lantibiotic exporter with double-glycine peptidase domain